MNSFKVVAFAALCMVFAGCGGEGDEGDSKAAGLAGDYVLDMSQMDKLIEDFVNASVPEAHRAEAMREIKVLSINVSLKEDGTYIVAGKTPKGPVDEKGNWKQDGEKITFSKTYEDGETLETPEVRTGTVQDGEIQYEPSDDMPFPLIFQKK